MNVPQVNNSTTRYLGLNAGQSGSYTWNSGLYSPYTVFVGDFGTGSFIHSGGTVVFLNAPGAFLGLGVGQRQRIVYHERWRVLSVPTEYVGGNGLGSFVQQGGSNTISGLNSSGSNSGLSLVLGFGITGSGSYILNAGSLVLPNSVFSGGEYIGYCGSGSFTQWGGTNTIAGEYNFLAVGQQPGSNGTYTLNGGSLSAPLRSTSAVMEPAALRRRAKPILPGVSLLALPPGPRESTISTAACSVFPACRVSAAPPRSISAEEHPRPASSFSTSMPLVITAGTNGLFGANCNTFDTNGKTLELNDGFRRRRPAENRCGQTHRHGRQHLAATPWSAAAR